MENEDENETETETETQYLTGPEIENLIRESIGLRASYADVHPWPIEAFQRNNAILCRLRTANSIEGVQTLAARVFVDYVGRTGDGKIPVKTLVAVFDALLNTIY